MTRERAKELLPVIQAFAEGKTIQFYDDGEWFDCYDPKTCTFAEMEIYRIKSEPREFWIARHNDGEPFPFSYKPNAEVAQKTMGGEIIHVREVL